MIRVLFGIASAFAIVGTLWTSVTPAQACSHVAVAEATDDAAVIVAGYLTQIDIPEYGAGSAGGIYAPARLHIRVDRVFKGDAGPDPILTFDDFDFAVRPIPYPSTIAEWLLTSDTGCLPAVVRDESPPYVIVGLQASDGGFQSSGESWLFVGNEPAGDAYDDALAAIESRSASDFTWLPAAVAATLGPLAFLAGAAFLWRRGG